ncbi:unnamed protein product [Paramecium pentaurelia]|uniref:Uncharacterized protein n=1 Tax=Paramecium pentaurelia TaxID=43138 RepID=A0A8S1U1A6_9CILI|nr:unnamed protein product [Paramecium pentaurelia]
MGQLRSKEQRGRKLFQFKFQNIMQSFRLIADDSMKFTVGSWFVFDFDGLININTYHQMNCKFHDGEKEKNNLCKRSIDGKIYLGQC